MVVICEMKQQKNDPSLFIWHANLQQNLFTDMLFSAVLVTWVTVGLVIERFSKPLRTSPLMPREWNDVTCIWLSPGVKAGFCRNKILVRNLPVNQLPSNCTTSYLVLASYCAAALVSRFFSAFQTQMLAVKPFDKPDYLHVKTFSLKFYTQRYTKVTI